MPNRRKSDEPAAPPETPAKSFAVDQHGKIDGIYRPHDDRRNWTDGESARLELAATPKRPTPQFERPVRASMPSSRKWLILLAIVGTAILLPVLGLWGYQAWVNRDRPAKAQGLLVIDSTPDNARVFIDGQEVGRTPYVVPNKYTPGTMVPLRVVYPGAKEWIGTFPGGVATTVSAELQAQSVAPP